MKSVILYKRCSRQFFSIQKKIFKNYENYLSNFRVFSKASKIKIQNWESCPNRKLSECLNGLSCELSPRVVVLLVESWRARRSRRAAGFQHWGGLSAVQQRKSSSQVLCRIFNLGYVRERCPAEPEKRVNNFLPEIRRKITEFLHEFAVKVSWILSMKLDIVLIIFAKERLVNKEWVMQKKSWTT